MTAPLVKDMGLRAAEILRGLPRAAGPLPWREDAGRMVIGEAGRGVSITLRALPDRRVGSLCLPVTRVTMVFDGLPEVDRQSFLARFDRAFHRGGG